MKLEAKALAWVLYRIDAFLSDVFTESGAQQPKEIVLEPDTTNIPLYGRQPASEDHRQTDARSQTGTGRDRQPLFPHRQRNRHSGPMPQIQPRS